MEEQISDFLDDLQSNHCYAPNTIQAYRNDLTQFLNFAVAEHPHLTSWGRVDKPLLLSFMLHLKHRGRTAASVARKIAVIKSFYHFLSTHDLVADDPAATLDAPRYPKRAPQILTPEEVERLLAAPAKYSTPKGYRDRAILELLYASGLRVSELVSLDIDDVDVQTKTVYCARHGGKVREIPIADRAVDALLIYLERGRAALTTPHEQALFVNPRGERLTRQGLWLIIREYVQEADIAARVTPHTLRHSFAVHLLNRGENLENVRRLLGHSNITTTQVYARLAEPPVAQAEAKPQD